MNLWPFFSGRRVKELHPDLAVPSTQPPVVTPETNGPGDPQEPKEEMATGIELEMTNYEEDEPFAFVSYARKDQQIVFPILKGLQEEGYRLWFDKEGIKPAEDWEQKIYAQMKNSNCLSILAFLSPAALESPHVQDEVRIGKFLDKDFVPVLLDRGNAASLAGNFAFLQKKNYVFHDPAHPGGVVGKISEGLGNDIRRSSYQNDAEILGLGYLPTIQDHLNPEEVSDPEKRKSQFRNRQKELVRRMRENRATGYEIDNVFQLTSKATEAMQRLEDLPGFESHPDRPHNLVSRPLRIQQAFVAPLRLVTGLVTRLDDNWPPLVASYGALVGEDHANKLDDLHYFIEFCWLAWGPSVSTLPEASGGGTGKFVVLQAAYGDEANSLPLLLKRGKWDGLPGSLDKLRANGCPVALRNAILVKPGVDDFFSDCREYPLLKDRIAENPQGFVALYLPHRDEGFADGEIEAVTQAEEAFYSTAYVWLMLEQIPPPDDPRHDLPPEGALRPGWVIPFFEHANLAMGKCLDFLQHCLARKAIYHVLECEREPDYQAGYYRFATALFPSKMVATLKEEIARLPERERQVVARRMLIPESPAEWRSAEEVVAFANDVYGATNRKLEELSRMETVQIVALDETDGSLDQLRTFYGTLYTAEFPDENERELLENMENYLRLRAKGWYGRNNYHILLLCDRATGEIAGGCVADYLARSNVGIIEFMVVDPARRGQGFGKKLLGEITRHFERDAKNAGHESLAGVCGEVNDPYRTCELKEHLDGYARLRMWHRFGFRLIDFPYVQPALSAGQKPVRGLGLMFQPRDSQLRSQLPSSLVENIVADFQIWAMRIDEPDQEPEFQAMRDWLRQRPFVPLLDMSEYGCLEQAPAFRAETISGPEHPLLEPFRGLYSREFSSQLTAEDPAAFSGSRVVDQPPVPYRYWMWGLLPATGNELAGLGSFFSFPHCGFGGYFAFDAPLRGNKHLRRLIRLVEKEMVGANPQTSGWYIECERYSDEAAIFSHCGFTEVPVVYLQPRLITDRSGVSDGHRLALLYKPFGRVYALPILSVEELKRDLSEILRVVYQLDDESLAACLDRIGYPCAGDGNVFSAALEEEG